jgi:ElaB/YqjD/DUF883 family membrane-anchored ribosome-binding protein
MNELTALQRDKLIADLRLVVADAEELLRLTANQVGAGVAETRTRIEARLQQARTDLAELQQAAVERARAAGRAADDYVHTRPWTAIGVAACLALAAGVLIARR